jgi:uncharacterized protein (DUF1330 family)
MSEAIFMMNVLWFKKDGGLKKYMEYGAAVAPLLEAAGAEVKENYSPEESLIGDWDPDLFFVVRYPSKAAFESMVSSPEYAKIMHLREEALQNSLLVRCKHFEWS